MMQAMMPRGFLFLAQGFVQEQGLPVWLYFLCIASTTVALVVGAMCTEYVNQACFAKVLRLLIIIAASLLIASGCGLVPHH